MHTPEETVTQLFIATDQQDWAGVKDAFDTRVLLDYSSMTGSPAAELTPDEIISAWKGILPGFAHTHHQLGNFLTTQDGARAKVFCYGTATHYLQHAEGNVWTVVGSYNLELVRQSDGQWKIAAMKFNYKYQDGNLMLPAKAMERLRSE
ncbi:MAG: nuclear transport factor 2 family protein [Bacteroidetes bacterium]|jgi:hypothetical protein|nr:nuclear transport factor 2 family protein [Bacteroidota bacterium]